MRPLVVVMARAPRLGQVKTRLAAEIGDAAALAVYQRLLGGVVERLAQAADFSLTLAVTPDDAAFDPALWPGEATRRGQGEGDLGRRMARLLGDATPTRPVAVVGSDIPGLDAAAPRAAFATLRAEPLAVALGPAADGGFYLIAAAAPLPPHAFDGLLWSHDRVADEAAARLEALGRPARFVGPRLADVDVAADLPAGWVSGLR